MVSGPSRYQTPLAALVAATLASSGGCSALGLMGNLAGGGARSGLTPSPAPLIRDHSPEPPGVDVFRVVAWGMAIVLGSLVLAFVARLLNARNPQRPLAPGSPPSAPPAPVPPPTTES